MSIARTDLSKVVLILGSFVGVDDILKLSENSRYEFYPPLSDADTFWKGEQSEQDLQPPFLCLTIGKHLFEPRGWIFGSHSDSDKCDLQLAENNRTGISRRFFRLDIDPVTHDPRITVLSDRRIRVYIGDDILTCSPGLPLEFAKPATIDLGAVSFRAWPPKRTTAEDKEYHNMARIFSEEVLLAVPKYIPPINSKSETPKHIIRYGKNGAVYVCDGGVESKGMSASVMKVQNRTTGEVFGAKEPYWKTHDQHDIARKRFEALQREYEYIITLDHPHILKAYELVLDEDITLSPWMIVEYIPLNLHDILKDLEERYRPIVLSQLSSALHHMHERGISHRDVKPENVLVQKQNQEINIKLADFGTSKRNAAGKMDTFTGTEIYMAPELFTRPRNYTNKVDIWGLGLIGMLLFTKWDPASHKEEDRYNFDSWMRNVILPHMAEAPEQYRPWLTGLLRKNPVKRWSAWRSLKWGGKHTHVGNIPIRTDARINEEPGDSKKRPAPVLDEQERRRRSPNPSLLIAGARDVQAAERSFEEERTLPDTLPPGAWVSEPTSTISTPHPDDDRDAEVEESFSDRSDTELEDDWQEDVG